MSAIDDDRSRALETIRRTLDDFVRRRGGEELHLPDLARWAISDLATGQLIVIVLDRTGVLWVADAHGRPLEEERSMVSAWLAAEGCYTPMLVDPGLQLPPAEAWSWASKGSNDHPAQGRSNGADSQALAPEMVAIPRSAREWRKLKEAASEALGRWRLNESLEGLWPALTPASALRSLTPEQGATLRDYLAEFAQGEVEPFAVRWRIGHFGTSLAEQAVGLADHDAVEAVLRAAWPGWFGWHAPLRTWGMDELCFDLRSGQVWDIVTPCPLSDASADATVLRALWPHNPKNDKPVQPSRWIKNRSNGLVVESTVWLPGRPHFVPNLVATTDSIIEQIGARSLNLYRPPAPLAGLPGSAAQWLRLAEIVAPENEMHVWILDWLAFLLQHPAELPRAALVLAGGQGIGKDAFLQAIYEAVGPWNVRTLSPDQFMGRFNGFARSKLIVINEDRANFFEGGAHGFYARVKEYTASPPAYITVEEKFLPPVAVPKLAGLVITTNELLEMHLEHDDRRLAIAKATVRQGWHIAAGEPEFFTNYFDGLERGDGETVRRLLLERRLDHYDPARPPPISQGKRSVLLANAAGDDALSGALDTLGNPDVVFGAELRALVGGIAVFNSGKRFDREMGRQGYAPFPNPDGQRWKFTGQSGRRSSERVPAAIKISRKAYVRAELMDRNSGNILSLVVARGNAWVAGKLDADGPYSSAPDGLF